MTVRTAFLGAILAVTAAALVVAFPSSRRAPVDPGLCWTVDNAITRDPSFAVLDRNIENAETCGARLEAVRLMRGGAVAGAYNGVYLWADDDGLSVGTSLDGPRRELMSQDDRARIDAALGELIRQRAQREGVTVVPAS